MDKERILTLLKTSIFLGLFLLAIFDPGNRIEYIKIASGAGIALLIEEGKKGYEKKKKEKEALEPETD